MLLAAVAYGWVRPRLLEAATASWAHRASGDSIAVLTILVATACVSFYGFEEGGAHALFGCALLGLLAIKVLVVRVGGRVQRLLPLLGVSILALFGLAWLSSAGDFLGVG